MKKRYWLFLILLLIVGGAYLLGPRVPEPIYDTALPQVPGNVQAIADQIVAREADLPVREGNAAHVRFYNKMPERTKYAVVYLHGFGASYRDAYPVNYQLADSLKANLFAARWGDHGLKPPHSLVGFTAESAWAEAKEALAIGKALGDKVIILSTSTGGTLAMKLAAEFPDDVYALVNFSPNVKDDMPGAWLLGTPWGEEIATLIGGFDGQRKVDYEEPRADQFFDTSFVASALVDLQVLVKSTMTAEATFNKIKCPILTLYYYKDSFNEDERVEVDVYPKIHIAMATDTMFNELKSLPKPGTHFLGSGIMSEDLAGPLGEALRFIRSI
ncbi:carboxylesterase [Lewinella sp. 4G2]|uniref:alpha/beta hydrolase n=1 Tax=Lewinella sp. 4G2 TaxID=1803372 RepID=UPI0007B4B287|nr:alpha/beta hydrolase [Lewinella sp. 4G2]OAV43056.1 hypothetical protein A3850_000430 [Lewinella sp. 4G2]